MPQCLLLLSASMSDEQPSNPFHIELPCFVGELIRAATCRGVHISAIDTGAVADLVRAGHKLAQGESQRRWGARRSVGHSSYGSIHTAGPGRSDEVDDVTS